MATRLRIRRKNALNILKEADKLRSFDDFPVLRDEVDPQLHVSRNETDQPFWLESEKDTVLAQVSGRSQVAFRDGPVRYFDLTPGEFVYVPGGSTHRILTAEPGVVLRYKARLTGEEAVRWFCRGCDTPLFSHRHDGEGPVQASYADAIDLFNDDEGRRACPVCQTVHPPVDISLFRFRQVADVIAAGDDDDDD